MLDGNMFLRTEPLSLGRLTEATFAAEVKVTTSATVPMNRYISLVVVVADNGTLTGYVDGAVAGTAQVSADGINGCAVRQLRFAADQGGGQRLTGAVDRVVIFARALTKDEVANWQARTFG